MSSILDIQGYGDQISESRYLADQTRASLAVISTELVQMYRGGQIQYLYDWLAQNISDSDIRRRYQKLAVFSNIVRLLVDHVSTLGQVPVRVVWLNRADDEPDPRAQAIWETICDDWMSVSWDPFIQSLSAKIELVKTAVVGVEWDPWAERLSLKTYSPAEIDTAVAPANKNTLEPDYFTFYDPATAKALETWDFSSRALGASAVRRAPDGEIIGRLPVIDPRTGRSASPFVPFRTTEDGTYFVWDGQQELRNAQEFVNRLYTRLSVLSEMGTNKTLVLSGAGWVDADGKIAPIPLDITKAIKEPDDVTGESGKPKIRWDGPAVTEEIRSCLDVVSHWVETTAATFRINASAIRAKNEATSGYALQIESSALKAKHTQSKNAARPRLLKVVKLLHLYWDTYGPDEMKFGQAVYPVVIIPDYSSAATMREDVDADIALVNASLKRRLPVIYKHEPGIPPVEAYRLAQAPAPPAAPVQQQTAAIPDSDDSGTPPAEESGSSRQPGMKEVEND